METISFRQAVRLIHPDTNPSITDAGVKMNYVMAHKDNEENLYKLMNYWKLLPHQVPKPEIKVEKKVYILPNTIYNGSISVGIVGIGMIKVLKTTAKRVYFTKEEKTRTGRSWANVDKIQCAVKE